jgi:hypothetical protein
LAERVGFEPTVVFSYARFPGVCLKPLSHLSAESQRPPDEGIVMAKTSARNLVRDVRAGKFFARVRGNGRG